MADRNDFAARLGALIDERVALETRFRSEPGDLGESARSAYDRQYESLQRRHAALFRAAADDQQRVTAMLEMLRILENRLVYLQNFIVDTTAETRMLAQLVTRFVDHVAGKSSVLTSLESTYYRAVAALYAGELDAARRLFGEACASEESDEANDIKYKSYVILGHLSHAAADYAGARELHEKSMRYSANENVTAQALALRALNSYAMQDHDEALRLFTEALARFREDQPFFNSYFYRNALLFCGAIHFDRRQYEEAERYYRRVAESVDQSSFDHFDALSHLGRIAYARRDWEAAIASFEKAVRLQRFSENEYVVDNWFWIARCHLRRKDEAAARPYLEKVASTDVRYEKKPQALELLQRIA